MSGQDLYNEIQKLRGELNAVIKVLKKRGQDKAESESQYRIALAKEILIQRDKGIPVTIISDICRGKEEIAKLKLNRDISEIMYDVCMQKVYSTKLEIGIVENQMNAERKGV